MKLKFTNSLLILGLLALSWTVSAQESRGDKWELAKSGDGVEVYTRQNQDSKIKAYKAVLVVKTTMSKVEAVLDDIYAYPEWQENTNKVELVKKISENHRIEHYYSDTPWPIADRDLVYEVKKEKKEDGTIVVKLTSLPDAVPINEDYLRIEISQGSWLVEPLANGTVRISQEFFADPGGSLPTWLINSFLVTGPYNSMINMRERL